MASFLLNKEVTSLLPYLNAVAERAELHKTPRFIRFRRENRLCVLYSKAGLVTPVDDRPQARSFLDRLMAFLNDIDARRHEITPNHRLQRRVSVLDILKLLPKNNCGQCGHTSCMAFAGALSLQRITPEKCPHMRAPLEEQAFYPVYDAEGKSGLHRGHQHQHGQNRSASKWVRSAAPPRFEAPLERWIRKVRKRPT